jgi:hypothetical protein
MTSGRNVGGRLNAWDAEALELEGDAETCTVLRRDIAKATIEAEL